MARYEGNRFAVQDRSSLFLTIREYLHVDTSYIKIVWDKISVHTRRKASVTTSHCVERVGVCVVADSDAVLGSGDKKNLRSYNS